MNGVVTYVVVVVVQLRGVEVSTFTHRKKVSHSCLCTLALNDIVKIKTNKNNQKI